MKVFNQDNLDITLAFQGAYTGWAIGQRLLTYSLAKFFSGFIAVSMLSILVIVAILAMLLFAEQLSLFNYLAFIWQYQQKNLKATILNNFILVRLLVIA